MEYPRSGWDGRKEWGAISGAGRHAGGVDHGGDTGGDAVWTDLGYAQQGELQNMQWAD